MPYLLAFLKTGHRIARAVAVVLVLLLPSCGGDSGTTPDDPGTPKTLTIALSSASAMPGATVMIIGVPASTNLVGAHARIEDVASDGESSAYVGRDGAGNVYLVTPLRPATTGIADGGDVDVSLAGNGITSNRVRLAIEPLPAANTTVDAQVTLLQDLATAWFAFHGTSRAELRALDTNAIPPRLFPLWVAQQLLDDPANPNSLRAMVDGTAPLLGATAIDFELADRLISTTDWQNFFSEGMTGLESLSPLSLPDAPGASERAQPGRPAAAGCIDGGNYGITGAPALDRAMCAARFAGRRLDGASGQYVGDLARFVSIMGTIPELRPLATVAGGFLFIYQSVNQAASAVLPSAFADGATDFDIKDKEQFYEDDDGGNWANFRVTAVSDGWQMDEFILGSIATVAGFSDFGGFASITEGLGELAANLTEFAINDAVAAAISAAANGGSLVEICGGTWPDIDASDLLYSEASIPFGTSVQFVDRTFFDTKEPGTSTIKVETTGGNFGGAHTSKSKPVEVLTITVNVDPASATLETDTEASFTATVVNSNDDRVDWIVPAGLQEISRSNFDKTITVKTPSTPWSPVYTLTARSLANTGSREGKVTSDPRDGGAVIAHAGARIVISPHGKCVGNNETIPFTVTVTGVDNPVVVWTIDTGYGTINPNTGLYKAPPMGTSDDVIVATVVGHPELTDHATVHVGSCECYFDISVGGASSWHVVGSAGHYTTFGVGEGGIIQWQFANPDGPGGEPITGNFTASLIGGAGNPVPSPGSVGLYQVNAVYIDPSEVNSWTAAQDDPDAILNLDIIEYTSTYMEGRFTGVAVQRSDPQDPDRITSMVNVNVVFRTGLWNSGKYPCN
ncbi:MAG TPA: hypothetical protein VFX92_02480 [Candidatus Krumholzibacteria bacterium]|nr:hypothetical protein [Candidatus Krumholzibacteria bacterium]